MKAASLMLCPAAVVVADASMMILQEELVLGPDTIITPRIGIYLVVLLVSWLYAARVGARIQARLALLDDLSKELIALRKWSASIDFALTEHAHRLKAPAPPGLAHFKEEAGS